MALYTPESLEQLRQRVDLVEVVGGYVDLKRAGAAFKGLCPFHDEKSPSFGIQKGQNHYHCFGCGAHGDAIQFLMEYLNLSFAESVDHLAQKFGVVLEQEEGKGFKGPGKKALKEAMRKGSELYHTLLLHTEEGHHALQYLYKRGLTLDFIRYFQIGLAPRSSAPFFALMKQEGIKEGILRECGLLKQRKDGSWGCFFYDRITFPICDATGGVIGFSARKYREETFGGKYVNTPETPLFKKSRVLFGLHHSRRRIAKERRALIVEGQVDALRLIHAGLNFAVAGQGTAFTEEHAEELIKLGVQQVYLALDGDDAGQEAAAKIGAIFQREGVEVRIVPIPIGEDPDTLLNRFGPDHFLSLVEKAEDYLTFLVRHQGRHVDLDSPAQKSQLIEELTSQIRSWKSDVQIHESLRKLAHLMRVPEHMVGVGQQVVKSLYVKQTERVGRVSVDPNRILDCDLLRLLFIGQGEDEVRSLIELNVQPADFFQEDTRALFEKLMEAEEIEPLELAQDERLQELIAEILERKINRDRLVGSCKEVIKRMLERRWLLEREKINQQIQEAGKDEEEALALAKLFGELARPPELREE